LKLIEALTNAIISNKRNNITLCNYYGKQFGSGGSVIFLNISKNRAV
jgi:hypothetical protein